MSVAFRISGRLIANDTKLGDRVEAGQLLRATGVPERVERAPAGTGGSRRCSRPAHPGAQSLRSPADAARTGVDHTCHFRGRDPSAADRPVQVDAAEAQLSAAHDQVSFTELRADAPGKITATGPAAGEVVQAGQMIARIARQDGRDAVFDVPAQLVRNAGPDQQVTVSLTDDPAVTAQGRIRQVAAQADPITRTFEVKVGLTDPPPVMRLGVTVVGRVETSAGPMIDIPAAIRN